MEIENNPPKDYRISFVNKKHPEETWKKWKNFSECTEEEKEKANLRNIFVPEILLDMESPEQLDEVQKKLAALNYKGNVYDTNSRGKHIHLNFNNLAKYTQEERKEIRKVFIKYFGCDLSKASEETMVAIPGKPHFKSGNIKTLIGEPTDVINTLDESFIKEALNNIERKKEYARTHKMTTDDNFKDYHLNDPFFNYVKDHILDDNTHRNDVIFPSLACALVREGLSEPEIEDLMRPIIHKNFPGKHYGEFKGWLKKALEGQNLDYNPTLVNNWMKDYTTEPLPYDLTPIAVQELIDLSDNKDVMRLYKHNELNQLGNKKVKWLVEKWIAKGDICWIAGKAGSLKTTIAIHIGYCVALGLPVFNVYKTEKCNVLYINEENNVPIFRSFIEELIMA